MNSKICIISIKSWPMANYRKFRLTRTHKKFHFATKLSKKEKTIWIRRLLCSSAGFQVTTTISKGNRPTYAQTISLPFLRLKNLITNLVYQLFEIERKIDTPSRNGFESTCRSKTKLDGSRAKNRQMPEKSQSLFTVENKNFAEDQNWNFSRLYPIFIHTFVL